MLQNSAAYLPAVVVAGDEVECHLALSSECINAVGDAIAVQEQPIKAEVLYLLYLVLHAVHGSRVSLGRVIGRAVAIVSLL